MIKLSFGAQELCSFEREFRGSIRLRRRRRCLCQAAPDRIVTATTVNLIKSNPYAELEVMILGMNSTSDF